MSRFWIAIERPSRRRRATHARMALLMLALLTACSAPEAGPYFGDEHLLVMGVDTDAEADAVAQQLTHGGKRLVRRLRGRDFVALGFGDDQGEGQVRVVTARGIGLALDPRRGTPLQPRVRYALLEAPMRNTNDADGDGFEEVFVQTQPAPPAESCILIYRIRDSGFVDLIDGHGYAVVVTSATKQAPWRNPQFCATDRQPGTTAPTTNVPASADPIDSHGKP